jgi:hypothetical protein
MKIRHNRHSTKKAPPKTTRFCEPCGKLSTFAYNQNTLHSECKICGWRKIKV